METFQIRTDLALEARESVNEEESKLRGVSVDEHYEEETDIRITKVTIDTKNAEKTLGKPMGVYVTMEAPAMVEPDDDYHREISEALAEELLKIIDNVRACVDIVCIVVFTFSSGIYFVWHSRPLSRVACSFQVTR